MPKRRKDDNQLTLDRFFEAPPPTTPRYGELNFDHEFRAGLSQAIKECSLGRIEIAAGMTRLLGCDPDDPEDRQYRVTKVLLDAWSGQSKQDWRFPVGYLPAFIHVTGAYWLLDRVAQKCGCKILVGEEAVLAKWGRIQVEKQRLADEERALKKHLPKKFPKEAGL